MSLSSCYENEFLKTDEMLLIKITKLENNISKF